MNNEKIEKKIAEAQSVKETLIDAKESLTDVVNALENSIAIGRKGNFLHMIGGLPEEVEVFMNSSSIELAQMDEGYRRTIARIYFKSYYQEQDFFELNLSSMNVNLSEAKASEINQIQIAAQLLKTLEGATKEQMDKGLEDLKKAAAEAREKAFAHENEIRSLNNKINEFERQIMMNTLMEGGVEFSRENGIAFDLQRKGTFFNVKNVKLTKMSASGKTCEVELTFLHNRYNPDGTTELQILKRNIEKVKVDQLMYEVFHQKRADDARKESRKVGA